MTDGQQFVLKIIFFSAVSSLAIKYGGRLLPLTPTASAALMAVIIPTLGMALFLGWCSRRVPSGK
ncbi:MAG: hypothetical protein HC890_01120 [Chloroflexaceae bacterium]|nr:hypothetical protein [Chloroflexaceae bacterium]